MLQDGNTSLCLKKYHKNKRHLCFVTYIFTKHPQNECLINTHNLKYRHARCNCKLLNAPWFCYIFWVFLYIIKDHSCLNCISTKLSQIECLIKTHILTYRHATCDCKLWNNSLFYCDIWQLLSSVWVTETRTVSYYTLHISIIDTLHYRSILIFTLAIKFTWPLFNDGSGRITLSIVLLHEISMKSRYFYIWIHLLDYIVW